MIQRTIVGVVLAALAGFALGACGPKAATFRGNVLQNPSAAPDFTLPDQYGRPFRLSDQRDKVVLLFFGYTSCPDVCPTTLATWKQVQNTLGPDAERVRFVFVTVDPERDTPETVQRHLAVFSPEFVGLTGTLDELAPVYTAYGVFREKEAAPKSTVGYLMSHSAGVNVIDPEGRWRLRFSYGTTAEDMVYDIQQLLK